MMKIAIYTIAIISLVSCSQTTSQNELATYFYPLDTKPMVYVFRDAVKGIDERFHRIYRIDDSFGEHIVVEIYSADTRLLEAYNYNIDSLNLMDHMVVDGHRENQKGELEQTQFFPMSLSSKGEMKSRIPGPMDSTYIMYHVERNVKSKFKKMQKVLDLKEESVVFEDDFTLTLFGFDDEAKDQKTGKTISYYSKGYGLTRWHDEKKTLDFRLEEIMSETEWAKLVYNNK